MTGPAYKVCVVGAGILGIPIGAVLATKCPQLSVSVVDGDSKLIDQWNNGAECPIEEVLLVAHLRTHFINT